MPRLTTDLLSRRPSTSSAWLLATATAMAILPTLATAACYDRGGKLRESWVACNPDQPTSSCCSSSDFCMSNGLCLNAGGNQAYTQQGCTDKKWGPPCTFYCPIGNPSDGLYYMDYCWRGFDEPADHWCCGVGCCGGNGTASGQSGNDDITIPVATEIFRPGARAVTSSGPAGAATATTTVTAAEKTVTVTQTVPAGSAAAQYGPGGGGDASSGPSPLALGLGLGLGIPLLLVSAAAGWMFFKSRRSGENNPVVARMMEGPQQPKDGWSEKGPAQVQQQYPQYQQGHSNWTPSELETQHSPVELSGRQSRHAWGS